MAAAPGPAAAPEGLDHFKCYTTTKPAFKPRTVRVKDQFVSGRTIVVTVQTLCNPVRKGGPSGPNKGKILQPRAHLTCYQTRDSKIAFKQRKVNVTNQFGKRQLTVLRPVSLCVPSLKRKGTAPPLPTPNPAKLVDHFRCYAVKQEVVAKQLQLADQFVRTSGRTLRVVRLCNPVSKNGGPVRRRKAHLVCYSWLDGGFKVVSVRVRNQFGLASLRVLKPETLCLPSLKQTLG